MNKICLVVVYALLLASCSKSSKEASGELALGTWDEVVKLDTEDCELLHVKVKRTSGCCDGLSVLIDSETVIDTLSFDAFSVNESEKNLSVSTESTLDISFGLLLGPCLCIEQTEFTYEIWLD